MDSDEDIFLTQSKYSQISFGSDDINSDFESILDSDFPNANFSLQDKESDDNVSVNDDIPQTQAFEPVTHDTDFNDKINSSDEDLVRCSQQYDTDKTSKLVEHTSERFGKPLTDKELHDLENSAKNKNTVKKSQWALRTFECWYRERHVVPGNFEDLMINWSDQELNTILVSFITQVKNIKGSDYHGNTLHEILISLQYHLRQQGRDINLNDFQYSGLRRMLDAKMKSLAKNGIGIHKRRADVLSGDQEELLWERGILGEDNPQKLLDTVFYLNGICFCLRGGEEHHSLKIGDNGNFSFVCKNGIKHLKYSEGVTKTNSGGLNHKSLEMKTVVVGPNLEKPERCPVRLHEKYMSLRPTSCPAFYLRPLRYPKSGLWYCASPIGRQPLGGVVKRLCETAGIQGYFTNHSLRATVATRLYESGIDEQLIAERTGHRSSAIRGYKRTSEVMLERVDSLVQRKQPARRQSTSTVTRPQTESETLHTPPTQLMQFPVASSSSSAQGVCYRSVPATMAATSDTPATVSAQTSAISDKTLQFVVERDGAKITFKM